jgi:hypothetical protein
MKKAITKKHRTLTLEPAQRHHGLKPKSEILQKMIKFRARLIGLALLLTSAYSSCSNSRSPEAGRPVLRAVDLNSAARAQQVINCGDTLRLTHVATQAHLASHLICYKDGSTQQQVTATIGGSDSNELWIVTSGAGASCSGEVKDGAVIRLIHAVTQKYLHSHSIPSHAGQPNQFEVSAFGGGPQSDGNDPWRVEVEGGGVWATGKQVRLIHVGTDYALHSQSIQFEGTPGVNEVTTYKFRDGNDLWTAVENVPLPDSGKLAIGTPCCIPNAVLLADPIFCVTFKSPNYHVDCPTQHGDVFNLSIKCNDRRQWNFTCNLVDTCRLTVVDLCEQDGHGWTLHQHCTNPAAPNEGYAPEPWPPP